MPSTEPARTPINRLTLRTKVVAVLLTISLGPLFIAGAVNIDRAVEQGKRTERSRFAQSARFGAHAFAQRFDRVRSDARLIASRFPRTGRVFDQARAAVDSGRGAIASIEGWRDAGLVDLWRADYNGLFAALPDGPVFYTRPFNNLSVPLDLSDFPWFERVSGPAVAPGPLPPLTASTQPGLVGIAPVLHRDEPVAYVGLALSSEHLQATINLIKEGLPRARKTTQVALVAPDGRIIAHDDPKRVGGAFGPELASVRRPGTDALMLGDVEHLVARAEIGRTGWLVMLDAPVNTLYRHVHGLIWLLVAVIVLTFIIVLLIADYTATLLLEPIHELERGAMMIGSGALHYRIELETHRGDELGRLARVFNDMGENLEEGQRKLETYGRSLETARKELDAIVFGITHDLKKSLRGIEANASFIGEDYAESLDEDGEEMLESIKTNVDRINQLADDLIGLVEHERERGHTSRFDMRTLIEEASRPAIQRHGGEVIIEGELPALIGDRASLALAFENLIDNGLKFNRAERAQVTVSCADEILGWQFALADNGIGIDSRFRDRVFELFTRLNRGDEFSGNGTGLNLARRIIEEHRGRIELEDAPGGGSRFIVHLPKEASALTEPSLDAFRLPGEGEVPEASTE